MRNLTFVLLAFLAFHSTSQAQNYVVAVPPQMALDDAEAVLKQTVKLLLDRPAGTTITVYDGLTLERIVRLEVSEGNEQWRLRQAAAEIKQLKEGVVARIARDPSKALTLNIIDVPRLSDVFAREAKPVRCVVIGHMRYQVPRDPSYAWGKATLAEDGHIAASKLDTPFGTRQRTGRLKGVRVHFCHLDRGETDYENNVERFWAAFFTAQGGHLQSFGTGIEEVLQDARADTAIVIAVDPPLDPNKGLGMKYVAAAKPFVPPVPAPAKTVVILVSDGSISSKERLAVERAAYPRLASEFARSSQPIEFGVYVFRGKGGHDVYLPAPLTLLPDGSPGPGLMGFQSFVTTKDVRATASTFAPGSEVGASSGRKVMVSRMEPLGTSSVDTAFGLREALRILGSLRPIDTPILVLSGDADSGEVYRGKDVAIENQRLVEEVRVFVALHPRARVVSVYSGRAKASPQAFFEAVAGAAGTRGVYLDRIETMEGVLRSLLRAGAAGER